MNTETLRWLDEQKPELVKAARGYLKEHGIYRRGKRPRDPIVSTAQLRNLQNAANSGSSLEVLASFLRYQIGRGQWPKKEGDALEAVLREEVGGRREKAPADGSITSQKLEAELAGLFVGYLIHEFYYQCKRVGTRA